MKHDNNRNSKNFWPATCLSALIIGAIPIANAGSKQAEATAIKGIEEVIVTAQRRSQTINEIGMTISAFSGEDLKSRGVSGTEDLAKFIPGFTYQPSPFNTPVYTMRGVGFYDSTLSASPTVAVYTDEVPLPYSAMTKAAALDIERVEVLKGPQGTLYGNNTTGGAINYISAKPTDVFSAGADLSYGRFNEVDAQGFVSGPLTETLGARLAVRSITADEWQKSYTRDDELGEKDIFQSKLILEWEASEDLTITTNLNGWTDKSDTQAPQRIAHQLSVPANAYLGEVILNTPLPPLDSRSADWSTTQKTLTSSEPFKPEKDDSFFHGSIRADYDIDSNITLTSITAYSDYDTTASQDLDGLALNLSDVYSEGTIKSFSQEIRLIGESQNTNWVVGVNYQKDETTDSLIYHFLDSTTSDVFGLRFSPTRFASDQDIDTYGIFGNIEYAVSDNIKLIAGARYTENERTLDGCSYDVPGGGVAAIFDALQGALRGEVNPIPPGGCFTLDENFVPISPSINDILKEDNVSWKIGINYETDSDGLFYASASQGYKSGSFPTAAASSIVQFAPVVQESVLAYELGFKQQLWQNRLQVNGAIFYYDYEDKQLRGRLLDAVFGPLDALVQIPKSEVQGAEFSLHAMPLDGLTVSVAGTYIDTKIEEFVGYNQTGILNDYAGSKFPYSPEWEVVSDIQYEFSVTSDMIGYVGASYSYSGDTNASIGAEEILKIDSYGLLDLRAGIDTVDGKWGVQLWGRNVTDEYYWTNAVLATDGPVRYTGRPATYGIRVKYNF